MSPKKDRESSETTMAIWYALTIQIELAGEACKSVAMVGSATLAIAPSRTAIEIPIIIVRIAPYLCGRGSRRPVFFP